MNIAEARVAILELAKIDARASNVAGFITSYQIELKKLQERRSNLHKELINAIVEDFKLPLNNNYLNAQALSFLSGLITETEKVVRAERDEASAKQTRDVQPPTPTAPTPAKTSRAINLES